MHELSIAVNIVDLAQDACKEHNELRISKMELEIGQMSGIVPEALRFALDEAIKNSVLSNAIIDFKFIESKAKCSDCGEVFKVESSFELCPKCNSFKSDIICGQELKINKITF